MESPLLNYHPLRLWELDRTHFEHVCQDVWKKKSDITITEKFGLNGQAQRGVDIIARRKDNHISLGSCKNYKVFRPSDLKDAVKEFWKHLEYWKSRDSVEFIVFIGCSKEDTKLQELILDYESIFTQERIRFILWDNRDITDMLREHHEIGIKHFDVRIQALLYGTSQSANGGEIDSELGRLLINQMTSEVLELEPNLNLVREVKAASISFADLDRIERSESEVVWESFEKKSIIDDLKNWWLNESDPPFAAVLGETGSGKTTMLQMFARESIAKQENPPVIFIDLKNFSQADTKSEHDLENILNDCIKRHGSNILTADYILKSLREEGALIIFDGLDERIIPMTDSQRKSFINELWRVFRPQDLALDELSNKKIFREGTRVGKLLVSCRSHYFPSVVSISSGLTTRNKTPSRNSYKAFLMLPWTQKEVREYITSVRL